MAVQLSAASPSSPPDYFLDPVTYEVMSDPVVCTDGRTYDRSTLDKLTTSPFTREPLKRCVSNVTMRGMIFEAYPEKAASYNKRMHMTPPPMPDGRPLYHPFPSGEWECLDGKIMAYPHHREMYLAQLNAAIEANPEDPWPLLLRSRLWREQNLFGGVCRYSDERIFDDLHRAYALDPHPKIVSDLVISYSEAGLHDEAITWGESCSKLEGPASARLAYSYVKRGREAEAERIVKVLNRCRGRNLEFIEMTYNLALVAYLRGKLRDAYHACCEVGTMSCSNNFLLRAIGMQKKDSQLVMDSEARMLGWNVKPEHYEELERLLFR